MARPVLIELATLASIIGSILALGACYRPSFVDCATTCGESGLCPEGLACSGGFCRVAGATNRCDGEPLDATTLDGILIDAMVDAKPIDAPLDAPMACPMRPQGMMGCTTATPTVPTPPFCYVLCNPSAAVTSVQDFSVGMWRGAVLSDAQKHNAALLVLNGATAWIELTQQPSQASPGVGWQWGNGTAFAYTAWVGGQPDDGGGGGEDNVQNCAALTPTGWVDEPCTAQHPFLIEHLPPP